MSVEDGALKAHHNFDPVFCHTVVRIGAIVCALIVASEIVLLMTIDSSTTRCPGWVIVGDSASQPMSLWVFVLFSSVWTLIVSYYAVTWRRFAQKILSKIDVSERTWVSSDGFNFWRSSYAWKEFNALAARSGNLNSLLVLVMIASAFVAAIPLLALAIACT